MLKNLLTVIYTKRLFKCRFCIAFNSTYPLGSTTRLRHTCSFSYDPFGTLMIVLFYRAPSGSGSIFHRILVGMSLVVNVIAA